jgi:hypothetical protein
MGSIIDSEKLIRALERRKEEVQICSYEDTTIYGFEMAVDFMIDWIKRELELELEDSSE